MVGNVTFEDFLLLTARFVTVGGRSGYQNRKLYIESNLLRLIAQEINGKHCGRRQLYFVYNKAKGPLRVEACHAHFKWQ
ncbi:hypothetical protein TI10_01775 [Photorhabdus luminescens subsp. luminescens]|nr:hypothetical protein TI10_01775 [Photorhabdus luminescens subsp. luminescens]